MSTPRPTSTRRSTLAVGLVILAALLIPISSAWSAPGSSMAPVAPGADKHFGPKGEIDVNSCSAAAGRVGCFARKRTDATAKALTPAREHGRHGNAGLGISPAASVGDNGAYSPSYLQSAYNAPSTNAGGTVAIVDAYDDSRAESDLAYYRSYFGLRPCTTDNGCFRKVDQRGGTSYPQGSQEWGFEISLDLDMVSAICPNCNIVLVEADTSSWADMGAAVNEAVALGAKIVSMSWGGMEYPGETTDNQAYFTHPGVAMVVSSGDAGYGAEFPASSNNVIAVGGTSLYQATATGTRNATETTWLRAGSGCSAYMSKPAWQHDTGCSKRSVADVSAVADPQTGVWTWDTYPLGGGWGIYGGTSVSAPIVAALYALAGNPSDSSTQMPSTVYGDPSDFNDITTGSNGTCGVLYLCTAGPGYDGPTGLGTPNSITPFLLSSAPTQPSVPAPTSLTAAFGHSIDLSWTAPAGVNVSKYLVERDGTQIGTTTNTYYYDDGVSPGGTYAYDVRAVDASGNVSAPSNVATASVPTAPDVPSVSIAAGNKVDTLTWTAPASTGGSAITGYRIYRGTASGGETLLKSVGLVTSYADTNLTNGKTYYYQVSAVTSAGEGARSSEIAATPATVPTQPSLNANPSAPGGIALTWSASQNGGSPLTGYNIYRGTASKGETLLATVGNVTTYTDTAVTGGTKYYYEISAVNAIGTSLLSRETSVTRSTPPSAPRSLIAAAGRTAGVTLKWSSPASTGGANVTGYNIYRATASGSEVLLATVGNVTSYTDLACASGTVYYYVVTAVNPLGEGPRSNESFATAH